VTAPAFRALISAAINQPSVILERPMVPEIFETAIERRALIVAPPTP